MDSLNDYFERLASAEPAPGGGSAAMVVGAAAAALVAMVARIRAAKSNLAKHAAAIADRADALRSQMLAQRLLDERAFDAYVAAASDDAKQSALTTAAEVPLEGARQALEALRLASDALSLGGKQLVSDIGCAAEFAYAALAGCGYNVRINHRLMRDQQSVARQHATLERYVGEADALLSALRKRVGEQIRS